MKTVQEFFEIFNTPTTFQAGEKVLFAEHCPPEWAVLKENKADRDYPLLLINQDNRESSESSVTVEGKFRVNDKTRCILHESEAAEFGYYPPRLADKTPVVAHNGDPENARAGFYDAKNDAIFGRNGIRIASRYRYYVELTAEQILTIWGESYDEIIKNLED